MPRANPDAPAAARSEQSHDKGIIAAQHLVASARQRLSDPAGFTYAYPKSGKGESEKSAYAQENFVPSGRDSKLSLDVWSNHSLVSQQAATKELAGRNRPVMRLVAPESVPSCRTGTFVPHYHRLHRSSTLEHDRRAATRPTNQGRSPFPPVLFEKTTSESVSQRGSSRRSAFAPVRGGCKIVLNW
jgi:hypothetical protein